MGGKPPKRKPIKWNLKLAPTSWQIEEQEKKVIEAEKNRDDQRLVLIEAVKDKKIIEKDKEKQRGLWKALMKKEDAKFMDEISSIGFVRKMRKKREDDLEDN